MAKKKAVHKSVAHASHAGRHKAKKSNKTVIISAIIAILVIAAGAYYFMKDPVLATVNGEKVMESEVLEQFNGLKTQYGPQITMDIALNQTIVEKLLMQEAAKSGIIVTDERLNAFIDSELAKSGQTIESFETSLESQNLTLESIRGRIKVQLAITELVNKTFSNVVVNDTEIKAFYDQNKNLFEGQSYSVVKPQIADYLKSQKQVTEFQAYVIDLRNNADVKIN